MIQESGEQLVNGAPIVPSEPPEGPVRVVEVPNRFSSRLLAVVDAIFHPFSTTVVRVIDSGNPTSRRASLSATAETGDASNQTARWF
jgi:hypothetical protein